MNKYLHFGTLHLPYLFNNYELKKKHESMTNLLFNYVKACPVCTPFVDCHTFVGFQIVFLVKAPAKFM